MPESGPFTAGSLGSGRRVRPPRPGSRAGGTVARVPIVVAIAGLLAAGALADRAEGAGGGTASRVVPVATAGAVSLAASAAALSSSWSCGGATGASGSEAPGRLVVTNAGPTELDGTATLVPSVGVSVSVALRVAARGQLAVPEEVKGGSPWIGAFVDLEGGEASVEQQIVSPLGISSTPCASTGSRSWYFTSGATLINETVHLVLLNPYPAAAIADLTFATDQGVEQTNDFQGLDVPARGMVVVDLGSHLRRRQRIATTVRVRTGSVVAWKTDIVTPPASGEAVIGSSAASSSPDPAAPIGGVTDTLGSPTAATEWTWPEGDDGKGLDEQYTVYNPTTATAQVELRIGLDAGSAQPFPLTVGPQSVSTVISSAEARVPAGVGHFAVVHSLNDVPVVAERTLTAGPPGSLAGRGEISGIPTATTDWLLASGTAPAGTAPAGTAPAVSGEAQEFVVVYNPGATPVTVAVDQLTGDPVGGLASVTVARRSRITIQIKKYTSTNGGLVIRASGPVVVEQDLYGAGGTPEISLAPGVPMATARS